ncbi:hypothetical protein HDV03_000684 [Kappamyces sp. JEL0829]|nr:hypothetical protein HDV03_000684 [Kappamyces sp. JEL0829]
MLLQFLRERQQIELKYAEELTQLVHRYKYSFSHHQNVDVLLDLTTMLTKDHSQVARFMASTIQIFERHNQQERKAITKLAGSKSSQVDQDMAAQVEKSREKYMKKCEALASSPQKNYEATLEMEYATQMYRNDIVAYEKHRFEAGQTRERAQQAYEQYEQETSRLTQGCLKAYAKSIEIQSKNGLKSSETFSEVVNGLRGYTFDKDQFAVSWPVLQPIYFEDYETKRQLKDLIFGVPLVFTIRNTPTLIPRFLKCSIEQIDKRGLGVEGIYRVAAKASEREKAKTEMEADLQAYDFNKADIHLLTGLIKAFFRDLPEPLFPFATADRQAYSAISHEANRIHQLKSWLKGLHRTSLIVLKFLVEHLIRVVDKQEKNKMGAENISLIFSALLFDKPMQPKAPGLSKDNWFSALKKKGDKIGASTESLSDSFKNDLVLVDLIKHYHSFFPPPDASKRKDGQAKHKTLPSPFKKLLEEDKFGSLASLEDSTVSDPNSTTDSTEDFTLGILSRARSAEILSQINLNSSSDLHLASKHYSYTPDTKSQSAPVASPVQTTSIEEDADLDAPLDLDGIAGLDHASLARLLSIKPNH